jgi:3-oxoacyl-[acyl-carrier protein] reductase
MSLVDLSGRVALVTGGSRGVGAATAVLLARAGANVALTYRERSDAAAGVAERIAAAGQRSKTIRCDVGRREDCDQAVSETLTEFGRLDIFVANAGIWPPGDIAVSDISDEQWRRTVQVNLDAVFYGTRAVLGVMQRGARIVVVSSTAGQRGEAYHADYAATKGALIAFVKSVAVEAIERGIHVNCVAPGWVDTQMCDVPFERDGGKGREAIERTIPLGRVAMPDEIAGPIVFLCSDLAGAVVGEVLNVNGGSVLCG